MVTTGSLRLLGSVTKRIFGCFRNDNETSWFTPKSLLDAAIKLFSAAFPVKKYIHPNHPLLLESETSGKFRVIRGTWHQKEKSPVLWRKFRWNSGKKNLWKNFAYSGKRLYKNLMRIFKFLRNNKLRKPRNFVPITWSISQGPRISGEGIRYQNRNWRQGWRSNKLRKPKNFIPFTWSIWQGPRLWGEIKFSSFDISANRPVHYFSSLNRLPELREYINSNRWPMLYILRKIPLC